MKLSDILKDIRRVHVELQDKDAQGSTNGICHNLFIRLHDDKAGDVMYETWDERYRDWVRSWPLFSGRVSYPVPGVREDLPSEGARRRWDLTESYSDPVAGKAMVAFDFGPKWSGITGYQRAQLLDHLIRCAEAEGL